MSTFLSTIISNFEKCYTTPKVDITLGDGKNVTNYGAGICGCDCDGGQSGLCDACDSNCGGGCDGA